MVEWNRKVATMTAFSREEVQLSLYLLLYLLSGSTRWLTLSFKGQIDCPRCFLGSWGMQCCLNSRLKLHRKTWEHGGEQTVRA